MNMKRFFALIAIAAMVSVSAYMLLRPAKEKAQTTNQGKIQVVATFYPLHHFAEKVGGDKVQVSTATPAGSEPHNFEPSPKDLANYQSANVFIYNGGNFEPWVLGFLTGYKNTAVNSSENLSLQDNDPHFWLDPVAAQQMIRNIESALAKAQPENASYFKQNADMYVAELEKLDAEIQAGLNTCRIRTAVTSHNAFTYFANRYNVTFKPIAGIEPEMEPSPAAMAEITKYVRENHVKYIFFETLVSPKLAETIAREAGAKTAVLDPIEGLSGEDIMAGKDYLSIQRENLAQLKEALECQ